MSRLIVRRRPDGLIQLRRRTAWHALADPAAAVLLGLLAGCAALLAFLATVAAKAPVVFLLTAPCLALGLWGARWSRSDRPVAATVPPDPRPPRRVA